ncbi:hypothetical protein BT96DRAFT_509722 [Gymnopus androsaceus JB14]|uniref:Uncharacterized protein n=1 Tax=Gymnopus androsaceus JB14 TaxID=1447944 RepID=A0A6A4GN58_9AGAR|nr:hypothetical protein BT96DRAFT_509722 [Gymnopus androsaceus JB14]
MTSITPSVTVPSTSLNGAFTPWNLANTELLPKSVDVKNSYPGVPKKVWIFDPVDYNTKKERQTMVRQEYHDGVIAILQWIQKMKDSPKDHPIVITPSKALEQASEVYPNPFMGENMNISFKAAGIVVMESPGIGKSPFLNYIWNLRCHLNLPTLYIPANSTSWAWKENKLFRVQLSSCETEDLDEFLPENTWCLVDSNQQVGDVPKKIYNTLRFIIQASLPRRDQLAWVSHAPFKVFYFAMQEWSDVEFIAGLIVPGAMTN